MWQNENKIVNIAIGTVNIAIGTVWPITISFKAVILRQTSPWFLYQVAKIYFLSGLKIPSKQILDFFPPTRSSDLPGYFFHIKTTISVIRILNLFSLFRQEIRLLKLFLLMY